MKDTITSRWNWECYSGKLRREGRVNIIVYRIIKWIRKFLNKNKIKEGEKWKVERDKYQRTIGRKKDKIALLEREIPKYKRIEARNK